MDSLNDFDNYSSRPVDRITVVKKGLILGGLVVLLLIPIILSVASGNKKFIGSAKSKASEVSPKKSINIKTPLSEITKVICPTGTVGQNGCNYIGASGIQQAIDDWPQNNEVPYKIYIKSGSYELRYPIYIGSAGHPAVTNVQIRGENRLKTVLDGSLGSREFDVKGNSSVELMSLNMINDRVTASTAVKLWNNAEVKVKNCNISNHDAGLVVVDSAVLHLNNSRIYSNSGKGIMVYGVASNANIIQNEITNNGTGGIWGTDFSLVTTLNNLIKNNSGGGIVQINNSSGSHHNNTIVNNLSDCIYINEGSNTSIQNNICAFNQGKGFSGGLNVNLLNNNLSFGNQMGNWSVTPNNTNLTTDPRFVNQQVNDFHLQRNSPAIDAGAGCDPWRKGIGQACDNPPSQSKADLGIYGGRYAWIASE